jgi:hypothetical protein
MTKDKNPIINLPAQIILNDPGEEYFSQMGIPLKTVYGISGKKKLGFQAKHIEVPFIKSLLRQNYFEEIYGNSLTLIEKKSELQDLTKLIFYGLIYSKFRPHLTEVLISSDLIERFNYKNPTRKITHQTQFNELKIRKFFSERKEMIGNLINQILKRPFNLIDEDDEIKEKDEKKMIMKTFLQHISLKEWFLFFLITNNQEERETVTRRISELMISYLAKTKISDYMGFLLIELIQNAEKASLEKVVRLKKLAPEDLVENYLKDKKNRSVATEFARQMDYPIEVSWKVKYLEGTSTLTSIRYELMVSNRGVIPKKVRQHVKAKSEKDVEGLSLGDFYQESSQELGAGLGLFYISYILEESKKQGIRFDSIIESEDEKDMTYVILRITI